MLVLTSLQRSHLRVQTAKTQTKTNHGAVANISAVEKTNNLRKQNLEDEAKKHATGSRGYSMKQLE